MLPIFCSLASQSLPSWCHWLATRKHVKPASRQSPGMLTHVAFHILSFLVAKNPANNTKQAICEVGTIVVCIATCKLLLASIAHGAARAELLAFGGWVFLGLAGNVDCCRLVSQVLLALLAQGLACGMLNLCARPAKQGTLCTCKTNAFKLAATGLHLLCSKKCGSCPSPH